MTDCGCLSNARELGREVAAPAPGALPAALAAWRAAKNFTHPTLVYLLGIGAETCQRIERGEVEAEPELAERIWRVIGAGNAPNSDASRPRRASVSPGAAAAGSEGGAAAFPPVEPAAPLAAEAGELGPPVAIPPPSPALAKADDGTFHVEMFLGRYCVLEMDIDEAEQLGAELQALAALSRTPTLYDRQPRLAQPASEES